MWQREIKLKLGQRDAGGVIAHMQRHDQLFQVPIQAGQRSRIKTRQGLGKHTGEWAGRRAQDFFAPGPNPQGHDAAVIATLDGTDQFQLDQRLDQVAGGGLVHVHGHGQVVDPNSRSGVDHTQRPELRPSNAGIAFNLPKVGLDGVEDHAKTAQDMHGPGHVGLIGPGQGGKVFQGVVLRRVGGFACHGLVSAK